MNDPLAQRELELIRMRADEWVRVAEVDRRLRVERAAEPKAADALLDVVASMLIGAGERLKARSVHLAHAQHAQHSCPERGYP